ncbi:MAG: DMT family transporter [Alphaproteobacteria bacterium]|nr:MAG: DMT family transporter [Alphaproteobacteria bacterium]
MQRIGARTMALLLVLATLWGSAFLFIKIAVDSIPPGIAAIGRVFIALVIVAAVLGIMRRRLILPLACWKRLFPLGVFGTAIPFYLQNLAETRIPSAHAAMLMATAPIFTAVLAHFTTDEKLSGRVIAGFVTAFLGVTILVGPHALAAGSHVGLFHLLILAAAMSYAINLVLSRRIADISVDAMTLGSLAWGGLLLLILLSSGGTTQLPEPSMASTLSLVFLGTGSTAVAAFLTMYLVRHAGTQPVAMAVNLVPVIGMLLGAAVLGEYPGVSEFVAVTLILTGLLIVTRRQSPAGDPSATRERPARWRSQRKASVTMRSRSSSRGCQPSALRIAPASDTSAGGSPARRGPSRISRGAPFARSTAASTSRTE